MFEPTKVAAAAQGVRCADQPDQTDFKTEYDPGHPAADAKGYVKLPNVDPLIEALDMREAQRAYEANLNVIETARAMQMRTLDLLKKWSLTDDLPARRRQGLRRRPDGRVRSGGGRRRRSRRPDFADLVKAR